MAYFIIIGTDTYVKTVVDEIRQSHLQCNVVTSGCVVNNGDELYYQWECYNAGGEKCNNAEAPVLSLRDALTNQISQFKTLLPDNAVPNVFLIGSCFNEKDSNRLKLAYKSLCEIGGATLNNLYVDLVLVGYNLEKYEDVTNTPNWKQLRHFEDMEKGGRFVTDVLYINNMDYDGAATNVDAKLLGRFLSHWSTMLSSGGVNPKQGVQSGHYAIGLAERQYNFEDLVPFFRLAAEERILDKALHNPLDATRVMMDTKYYKRILLDEPWISGLCDIKDQWNEYCSYEFEYEKKIEEQPYSLSVQIRKFSSFFNDWLKIFCQQQEREKENYQCRQKYLEEEISALRCSAETANASEEYVIQTDKNDVESQIKTKEEELSRIKEQISECSSNIEENTFSDYRNVCEDLATGLLTEKQRVRYENDKQSECSLFTYISSDRFVEVITETINNINRNEETPDFPYELIDNIGALCPSVVPQVAENNPQVVIAEVSQENRPGCLGSVFNLFRRKKSQGDLPAYSIPESPGEARVPERLMQLLTSAIKEYRKVSDVLSWWNYLCSLIEKLEKRQKECIREMENYKPQFHQKSISLISMDMVKHYRDNDHEYQFLKNALIDKYFDSVIEINQRKTMPDLIDDMLISTLREKWSILYWDGNNPFCNEEFSCDDINNIIEDLNLGTHKQSKPFVEYVKLATKVLDEKITSFFYFNHPNICKKAIDFRNSYRVGTLSFFPVFLEGFTNSLCEVQVLNICDYIDSIYDFKPKTQAYIHETKYNFKEFVGSIVGNSTSPREKAFAIYKWLCENITYDMTYQIHDVDTCWRKKRGVCQAYCELFYYLGKAVGLTVDIISGKTKQRDGSISERSHAWVFVYTNGYDGIFIDPTWGAGSLSEHGEFIKASDISKWFDIQPAWMVYTHFPEDKEWLKLDSLSNVLSEEVFEKLPFVEPLYENASDQLDKDLLKLNVLGQCL